jgi:hypothetical protein
MVEVWQFPNSHPDDKSLVRVFENHETKDAEKLMSDMDNKWGRYWNYELVHVIESRIVIESTKWK